MQAPIHESICSRDNVFAIPANLADARRPISDRAKASLSAPRHDIRANLPPECQPIGRSYGSLGMKAVQTPARGTRIPR
jgi:hypothetical protein